MDDEEPLTHEDLETLKKLLGRLIEISREAGEDHPLTAHAEMTYAFVNYMTKS